MKANCIINPGETERLDTKGLVPLTEIKEAMKKGKRLIGMGSTSCYLTKGSTPDVPGK